jgi:high-affinity nickel-transport protein
LRLIYADRLRSHGPAWFGSGLVRGRLIGIYAILFGANLAVWAWAFVTFRADPVLFGTALLAYTFGLRHAVDADHIAAIDNVTRKLMQEGRRSVAVGFFFALGHSTVVVLASLAVVATTFVLQTRFSGFQEVGGLIGTTLSALFLFVVALANVAILAGVYRAFRRVRQGGEYIEADIDRLLAQRGLFARFFAPVFRMVTHSWHMYPVGFLFGLGFDTATEIALLDISAAEVSKGLSAWSVMVFPALFTAGMSLIDTTDGVLMLGAYGWAFARPIRKLYYNLTITFISVIVAFAVGGVEVLGLVADRFALDGPFWGAIIGLNENFGTIGYLIIGIFVLSWLVSALIYRIRRYDTIEVGRPG